jgi:hypothetical protein
MNQFPGRRRHEGLRMEEQHTIEFEGEGEDGVVIVRGLATTVGLCVSVRRNGDAEAFLTVEEAEKILGALEQALETVRARL